jgi:hypothetical protein
MVAKKAGFSLLLVASGDFLINQNQVLFSFPLIQENTHASASQISDHALAFRL